jgi:hypothetical protein
MREQKKKLFGHPIRIKLLGAISAAMMFMFAPPFDSDLCKTLYKKTTAWPSPLSTPTFHFVVSMA